MVKIIFKYFLLIVCVGQVKAQLDIDYKIHTSEEGLGSYSESLKDSQGYTWFTYVSRSTEEIACFDGRVFSKHAVGSHLMPYFFVTGTRQRYSTPFLKDKQGYVWLGSSKGLYKMENGRPVLKLNRKNGLPSDSIVAMCFDGDDNLWMITAKGIVVARSKNNALELHAIQKEFDLNIFEQIKNCNENRFRCFNVFITSDKRGKVWWGINDKLKSQSWICLIQNYFLPSKNLKKFNLSLDFDFYFDMKNALLLRTTKKQYYCLDTNGTAHYLNNKFIGFFGKDYKGYYYFVSKTPEKQNEVYKAKAFNQWDFGTTDTSYQIINVPEGNYISIFVRDELWLLSPIERAKGFVVRDNSLCKIDSLYPGMPVFEMQISKASEDAFWGHKIQKQNSVQFHVSTNVELYKIPGNVNGCWMRGYTPEDSTLYLEMDMRGQRVANIKSLRKGILSAQSDSVVEFYEHRNTHQWFYYSKSGTLEHKQPNKVSEVYKMKLTGGLNLVGNGDAGFSKIDSFRVLCFQNNNMRYYTPKLKEGVKKLLSTDDGALYILSFKNELFHWDPLHGKEPQKVHDFPKADTCEIYHINSFLCFYNGKQAGWLHNNKVSLMDSLRFPNHFKEDIIGIDSKNRIFLRGNHNRKFTKEILVVHNEVYSLYPLNDSVEIRYLHFADCIDNTGELIYFNGTKIYRYNKELKAFYFLKSMGKNFGYIWSSKVLNHKLYVSGWSPYISIIDLDNCPVTFPKLSFRGGNLNGEHINPVETIKINYSDKFQVQYIAIENLNQSKIEYQIRLVGDDSSWTSVGNNELKDFANTPPGDYRFEVRARGDSEVWSNPIGFSLQILPPWYRTWWAYIFYFAAFAIVVRALIQFNTKRLKLENEQLENRISIATTEIREQKHLIEEKNKEITDSILYAQKIQSTLMASDKLLDECLKKTPSQDYFILYKPKDIVSGDYYWAHNSSDNKFLLITADCTGHGVPGAFMSLLCISYLNEVVKEQNMQAPHKIFDAVREKIVQNFRVHENKERKDGMDATLCLFDFEKKELFYAAANNPAIVIEPDSENKLQLVELAYDKMPVGVSHNQEYQHFAAHSYKLKPGSFIYTFTDGYADQFGGPKGKKFMLKRLRELLLANANLTMQDQKEMLDKAIQNWMGHTEQVDDILVIGIKV